MNNVSLSQQADDSLAPSFSLEMKAATSRWGILCDIAFISVIEAVLGVCMAGVYQAFPALPVYPAVILLLIPPSVPIITCLSLRRARADVVSWAASLPFPVENINAVLSGAGEFFDLHFASSVPSRAEINDALDAVSKESFVLEMDEEHRVASCRFGMVDHKLNTLGSANKRYERMKLVMSTAVVSLHKQHPVAFVQLL